MNDDFAAIDNVLAELPSWYSSYCNGDVDDPKAPITESDIVAEIRHRLLDFCTAKGYHVHCEVRPVFSTDISPDEKRRLKRIDVAVLRDSEGQSWFAAAKTFQPGQFARFAFVPVKFFHTAVEVKIPSKLEPAKEDLAKLKSIQDANPSCNCFFVLLNARGKVSNHDRILDYAAEQGITVIEFTAQGNTRARHNFAVTHPSRQTELSKINTRNACAGHLMPPKTEPRYRSSSRLRPQVLPCLAAGP